MFCSECGRHPLCLVCQCKVNCLDSVSETTILYILISFPRCRDSAAVCDWAKLLVTDVACDLVIKVEELIRWQEQDSGLSRTRWVIDPPRQSDWWNHLSRRNADERNRWSKLAPRCDVKKSLCSYPGPTELRLQQRLPPVALTAGWKQIAVVKSYNEEVMFSPRSMCVAGLWCCCWHWLRYETFHVFKSDQIPPSPQKNHLPGLKSLGKAKNQSGIEPGT